MAHFEYSVFWGPPLKSLITCCVD